MGLEFLWIPVVGLGLYLLADLCWKTRIQQRLDELENKLRGGGSAD